jgi:NAD(P)-dependent dehydrogenase (short-subunit alcohol dehydrogenase family)
MSGSLHGKRIIVTGGTAGIGQGIAILAAAEGADIAFCGHNAQGADKTFTAIEDAGGRAFFRALDLSDEQAARQFGQESIAFLGGLDGLVNNAGANFWHGVAGASREQIEACFSLNFYAAWALAQEAYPALKAAGGGMIVNMSSVHARHTMPGTFPYNVSKSMLVQLTKSIAIEWGRDNIQSVAIAPGLTMTPAVDEFASHYDDPAALIRQFTNTYPLGRGADVKDIAATVVHLLTGANRFISGTTIYVDGGLGALDPEARYEG